MVGREWSRAASQLTHEGHWQSNGREDSRQTKKNATRLVEERIQHGIESDIKHFLLQQLKKLQLFKNGAVFIGYHKTKVSAAETEASASS